MMSKLLFTHRYGVFIDSENNFSETLNDIFRLENLRFQNPENVIFSYLNINSVHNKFPGLTNLVSEHIDILKVADTKLGASFPTAQFLMPGFYKPFRLDVTANSAGLLVYVKGSLPARELQTYKLPFDIQAIPFEIYLRKESSFGRLQFETKQSNNVSFINDYDFRNLLKRNNCVKGDGSCIDLLNLTKSKYSFKFSTTFETALTPYMFNA